MQLSGRLLACREATLRFLTPRWMMWGLLLLILNQLALLSWRSWLADDIYHVDWRKRKPIPLQQNQTAELRRKTIVLPSLGLRRPLPPPQADRYPTIFSVMRRRRRSNSVWPGLW